MSKDQMKLEQFLNNLQGEVVAIIPSITPKFTAGGMGAKVNFILIVEKNKTENRLVAFLLFSLTCTLLVDKRENESV